MAKKTAVTKSKGKKTSKAQSAKQASQKGTKSKGTKPKAGMTGRRTRSSAEEEASEAPVNNRLGLIDECKAAFGKDNLYEVLELEASASGNQIKKAYYKLALKYHPDKHPGHSDADSLKEKFQLVGRVYAVLSDEEKRKVYDETGAVGDEETQLFEDLLRMFTRVTAEDIDNYLRIYCGSEEERLELLKIYEEHAGNWDRISECLVSYNLEEEDRLKKIIADAISSGDVQDYGEESAKKQKARKNRLLKERKEVEQANQQIGNTDAELCALIQSKQRARMAKLTESLDLLVQEEEGKAPAAAKRKRRRLN